VTKKRNKSKGVDITFVLKDKFFLNEAEKNLKNETSNRRKISFKNPKKKINQLKNEPPKPIN